MIDWKELARDAIETVGRIEAERDSYRAALERIAAGFDSEDLAEAMRVADAALAGGAEPKADPLDNCPHCKRPYRAHPVPGECPSLRKPTRCTHGVWLGDRCEQCAPKLAEAFIPPDKCGVPNACRANGECISETPCAAEPASERRPTCRSCGQFVDSRGKCRIPKHNDDA